MPYCASQLSFAPVFVFFYEHSMPKKTQQISSGGTGRIPEVTHEEVEARRKRGDDFVLLDVREKDEVQADYISGGAVTIPRAF